MMTSLNRACLIGNLGADPEMKTAQNGKQFCTFSLATGEKWKDRTNGEERERTEWHRVVIFSEGLAEIAGKYLRKGSKAYLEGAIRTRSWEQDGSKRYATEIVLNGFDAKLALLGDGKGGRGPGGPEDYGDMPGASAGNQPAGGGPANEIDDEIPF